MKGTKTQKGITLIALIITILVLLILAGVSIRTLGKDDGVIVKAQEAANSYKEAQIEEEVKLYSMEYALKNQKSLKEDTVNKMTQVSKETGVSLEKLTVHHNKKDGSEYILYRIDKVTEEEKSVLESEQYEVKALRGDIDLDGVLTQDDYKIINDAAGWIIDQNELTEIQKEIADMNGDTFIDGFEITALYGILEGQDIYMGGYIQ